MSIVEQQLKKLLKGKVLLVIEEELFEDLIQAVVPGLEVHADELEETEGSWGVAKARKLRALANELDSLPRTLRSPKIANVTTYLH